MLKNETREKKNERGIQEVQKGQEKWKDIMRRVLEGKSDVYRENRILKKSQKRDRITKKKRLYCVRSGRDKSWVSEKKKGWRECTAKSM